MKHLMKCVEVLMCNETINKIEILKVEDNKVELWSEGKYFGRHKVLCDKK